MFTYLFHKYVIVSVLNKISHIAANEILRGLVFFLENETVWLTLKQMASLFGRDKSVISRHIKAIFQERELTYEGSVAKNATVQTEGNSEVIRQVEFIALMLFFLLVIGLIPNEVYNSVSD